MTKDINEKAAQCHLTCSAQLTVLLVLHAQDDLWGSVVSGHHVWSHHEVSASCSGQAEIQDLKGAVRLHHDVTGLQVLRRRETQ